VRRFMMPIPAAFFLFSMLFRRTLEELMSLNQRVQGSSPCARFPRPISRCAGPAAGNEVPSSSCRSDR
jgi:hypothetical protein